MSEEDRQFCPICGAEVPCVARYPRYVCHKCADKAQDENDRPLEFHNESFSGGFVARYADTGEKREGHVCFIEGMQCWADEARFGGIVIQVEENAMSGQGHGEGEMNQAELDNAAYDLAKRFMLRFEKEGVTPELLEKYLHFSTTVPRPTAMSGIYERLLGSAQNAHMKPHVIGGAIGGVRKLGPVLCSFEPREVVEKYGSRWQDVLDAIQTRFALPSSVSKSPRGLWPQYCRSITSRAAFLSQFESAEDFYAWSDSFDKQERDRTELPRLVAREVAGIGFALACDFIKELGYVNFSKPDVHIKRIFGRIGLCSPAASDYEVFRAVDRVAHNVAVSPYNVDKLFWLVGSGHFYDDPQIGHGGDIGRLGDEFIAMARQELGRAESGMA